MSVTADTLSDTAVIEVIHRRWSPRSFQERMVPAGAVASVLEAARWAASSHNEQPWRYLVVTKERPAEYNRLAACLSDNNKRWAPKAPVLLLALYKRTGTEDRLPNRHALHDLGQANALLSIQAAALGLAIHPMGAFDQDATRAAFAIPQDHQPWLILAFCYPGTPDMLPEDLRLLETKPHERRPLADIAFSGEWGKSFVG